MVKSDNSNSPSEVRPDSFTPEEMQRAVSIPVLTRLLGGFHEHVNLSNKSGLSGASAISDNATLRRYVWSLLGPLADDLVIRKLSELEPTKDPLPDLISPTVGFAIYVHLVESADALGVQLQVYLDSIQSLAPCEWLRTAVVFLYDPGNMLGPNHDEPRRFRDKATKGAMPFDIELIISP